MSVVVLSHSPIACALRVCEPTWTANVNVKYIAQPTSPFQHHEGLSILLTSQDSYVTIDVQKRTCKKRHVVANIEDFPYHNYMCAEAWTLVWGKLYAIC